MMNPFGITKTVMLSSLRRDQGRRKDRVKDMTFLTLIYFFHLPALFDPSVLYGVMVTTTNRYVLQ